MNTFTGLAVALATPMTADQEIDLEAFRRLVRHVVAGGADILVPLGSTGEAATLLDAERDAVITACLDEAAGRPVVPGTGSNATRQAQLWTRRARDLGAAGALVVTPYYNKPGLQGLLDHYRAVADAAPGLPLVAYNVPGRTGLNLSPAMVSELWQVPQVVALKESSGNLAQIGEIARALPAGKVLLGGDDALALPSIACGARGLVSVLGNALPGQVKTLVDWALQGDRRGAALHHRLLPLMDALFVESNPAPLKCLLSRLDLCEPAVRLPLTTVQSATEQALDSALEALNLAEVA